MTENVMKMRWALQVHEMEEQRRADMESRLLEAAEETIGYGDEEDCEAEVEIMLRIVDALDRFEPEKLFDLRPADVFADIPEFELWKWREHQRECRACLGAAFACLDAPTSSDGHPAL